MPTFKSINDAVRYIENAKAESMREVGNSIEKIMKEEIQEQVYEQKEDNQYRTYQLINSVKVTKVKDNRVEVSWRDNGDWFSIIKRRRGEHPDHMYVIHGLDMGVTWNRPATNLVEESIKRARQETPDTLVKALRSKGIKAFRK